MSKYETREGAGSLTGGVTTHEEAVSLHHLATADPERDGKMTGPAHEFKYGLERAEGSAALWEAAGVHPIENRRIEDGEKVSVKASQVAPEANPDTKTQPVK